MSSRLQETVDRIRQQLRLRGLYSTTGLTSVFRMADKDGSGFLTEREFDAALRRCGIFLGLPDLHTLCRSFAGEDNTVSSNEFLSMLLGRLSERRHEYVRKLFDALDRDKSGQLQVIELEHNLFAEKHPDVVSGRATAKQVAQQFIKSIEAALGVPPDGAISYEEFKNYFKQLSSTQPDDDQFISTLSKLFGVPESGDAGVDTDAVQRVIKALRAKLLQFGSGPGAGGAALQKAFSFMDLRRTGKLAAREFTAALERVGFVLSAGDMDAIWKAMNGDANYGIVYADFIRLVDDSVATATVASPSKPPVSHQLPSAGSSAAATTNAIPPSKPSGTTMAAAAAPVAAAGAGQPKTRALLVGINYIGHSQGRLQGCINDTKTMKRIIVELFNFDSSSIKVLRDDDRSAMPTHANILAGLKWLVADSKAGDRLFFHYSGHGGQVRDTTGDEADGMDECLFPFDYQQAGCILDDELYDCLVKALPAGVKLTVLLDCCHSGTALDLKYLHLPTPSGMDTTEIRRGAPMDKDVVMISGCKDEQTSADAQDNAGMAAGAMTTAFNDALRDGTPDTYAVLLKSMLASLVRGRYAQKPQMCSEQKIDTSTHFTI